MPTLISPAAAPSPWVGRFCAVVLALAPLAAYHNSFRVPFLFDDTFAITDNASIRSLGELKQVLLPNAGYGISVSGRPVLNLSLALCYAVSGSNVWSYHALNLLIHILAGLTLFGIVRRTLLILNRRAAGVTGPTVAVKDSGLSASGRDSSDGRNLDPVGLAFAVALIWTLHPLQTEAVTYVIQRTESLMGLFFLLTLYCFIRAVTSSADRIWTGLAVAACLCAVGTKEVAATAPLLVFLYDRTFVAGSFREAWTRRRWFHLGLAATWVPLALLVASTGWNRGGTVGYGVAVSPLSYWLTQFEAIARYLKQSLWPHPLIFEYGTFFRGFRDAAPFALIVVPLLAATAVALWRWPVAGFLGAWFFVILAPTSLVPGTIQMIVEHRMYLPLIALIVAAVVGLHRIFSRWSPLARIGHHSSAWAFLARPAVPCLALAAPLGLLTEQRNTLYGDELALWRQTVDESPASAIAQDSLGSALAQRNHVREAVQHYRISLQLDPGLVSTHYNLGLAFATLGYLPEAIGQYREAVHLNPRFYPAHYQLGLALLQLHQPQESLRWFSEAARLDPAMAEAHYEWGVALAQAGRMPEAVEQYRNALRIKSDFVAAECDLGTALYQLNRVPESAACFERVLRVNPTLALAHFNLGLALARMGQADQALAHYTEAVRLDPANGKAQYNLGIALGQGGKLGDALAHLQEAVRLEPNLAEAHFNLGVALAKAHRLTEAVDEYAAALRLQPDNAEAEFGLGVALLQLRRVPEARPHFEAALRINPRFEPARAALAQLRRAGMIP